MSPKVHFIDTRARIHTEMAWLTLPIALYLNIKPLNASTASVSIFVRLIYTSSTHTHSHKHSTGVSQSLKLFFRDGILLAGKIKINKSFLSHTKEIVS